MTFPIVRLHCLVILFGQYDLDIFFYEAALLKTATTCLSNGCVYVWVCLHRYVCSKLSSLLSLAPREPPFLFVCMTSEMATKHDLMKLICYLRI